MKKTIIILLAVIMTLSLLAACGGGDGNNSTNPPASNNSGTTSVPRGNNGGEIDKKDPAASFAQFSMDFEKVKPNIGTPNETLNEIGNEVTDNLADRRAMYKEKSEEKIDLETGFAYNSKMFDYCKSVSADGKCYVVVYTDSDFKETEIVEAASYEELNPEVGIIELSLKYKWLYKFGGMWVDVSMNYTVADTDNIGISLKLVGRY